MSMKLTKKLQTAFLKEYKNQLLNNPYDEDLIVIYDDSIKHYVENKKGHLIVAKRKSYKKVVNEFIIELSKHFQDYIDINDNNTLIKIQNVTDGTLVDFNVFNDNIIKLMNDIVEESWLE